MKWVQDNVHYILLSKIFFSHSQQFTGIRQSIFFKMAMLKTNIIVVVSLRLNLNFKRVFPPIFLFQEESLLETQDQ